MPTTFTRFPSPFAGLSLTASDTALQGVFFPVRRNRSAPEEQAGWVEDDGRGLAGALLARFRRQLTEYFEGTRTTFDLPLDAAGSAFERRRWDLLRTIPPRATTSYGALARRLGDPRATRAVAPPTARIPSPSSCPVTACSVRAASSPVSAAVSTA